MVTDVSNYLTNIDGTYFDAVSNILNKTDNKTALVTPQRMNLHF